MTDIEEYADQLAETPAWERKPDEPNLWFSRFEEFRLMGPDRSVRSCYRAWYEANGDTPAENAPKPWYNAAHKWQWQERAEAWDKELRMLRRKEDTEAREAARQANQAALNMGIEKAVGAITTAKDGSGDQRLWVNTLTTLTAEIRKEFGYDVQRVQELDPLEVIETDWPEAVSDAD